MDSDEKQITPSQVKQSFIELTQAVIEAVAQSPRNVASEPDTLREIRESVRFIAGN